MQKDILVERPIVTRTTTNNGFSADLVVIASVDSADIAGVLKSQLAKGRIVYLAIDGEIFPALLRYNKAIDTLVNDISRSSVPTQGIHVNPCGRSDKS